MNVEHYPRHSLHNRTALDAAAQCGCYFCLAVYGPNEVEEYTDNGTTALCPHCGVDAILPNVTDKAALAAGLERWFTGRREAMNKPIKAGGRPMEF